MKILLIRLSSIGDCVLASPVVEALRDRYPEAEITWAVQSKSIAVVRGLPGLSNTILWDDREHRYRRLLRTLADTWHSRFDIALDLQGLAKSGLFLMASHARQRISGTRSRESLARWGSTQLVDEAAAVHAREFYLRRAAALDIAPDAFERYYPRLPLTAEHRQFASGFLTGAGIAAAQRLVGFNLGASHTTKRWPETRFAELADAVLAADDAHKVIVFGAPSDVELVDRFHAALAERRPLDERVISAAGRLDLMQMAAVAEHCAAFVTADTGPMHIAAAAGAPVVALFGPTDDAKTGPVQKPGAAPICVLKASDVTGTWPAPMEAIEVEAVLHEVQTLLARWPGPALVPA